MSSSERSQKAAPRQSVSTLVSGDLHSSVSVHPCLLMCCGCHTAEILPTRRPAEALSLVGNARSQKWPAQAPTLQFVSATVAREPKTSPRTFARDRRASIGCLQPEDTTTVKRSEDRWRRQFLITSGDVEPNPGPPRGRPCLFQDLLLSDVMSRTAALVGSEEATLLPASQIWFDGRQLGTLISGLQKDVALVRSRGGALPESSSHYNRLWKRHRS